MNENENELFNIPEEALKKIRTQEEFEDYFQTLYKKGVEALLKAEIIKEHLGYSKHEPAGRNTGNSRNGYSKKYSRPIWEIYRWRYPVIATLHLSLL